VDFVVGTDALSNLQLISALKSVLDIDVLLVSDVNPIYAAFYCPKASVMKSLISAKDCG